MTQAATTTVVTLHAPKAEESIARYLAWAGVGATADDLGTLGTVRRYRVDERTWASWTASLATAAFRCTCGLASTHPAGLTAHLRANPEHARASHD